MMLKPSPSLTPEQVRSGLTYVTRDGLFTEAMVAFTGGTFLVAMAMKMGASNVQIGILAAMPTLVNILQLLSVWLVQRYNNRRAISVISSFLARFPLLIIGILPFVVSKSTTVTALILLLFFHYAFGAISGASWNSWMKDLVPHEKLGSFFSYRTRVMQIANVVFSLLTALSIDYIKLHYPQYEIAAYPVMFIIGGVLGMISVMMMSKTPEPVGTVQNGHLHKLLGKPFQDKNFRTLLIFNAAWAFSLNLATPFFSVYMLKTLHISLSTVIILGILGQVSGIVFVRIWGKYSDSFSNKTIIRICAPVYIACIAGWTLVGNHALTIALLLIIHIISGITNAGITLSLTNIGYKLTSKDDAMVYLTARNMVNAFIPALAPIFGGMLADLLTAKKVIGNFSLSVPVGDGVVTLFQLSNWTVFFVFSAILAAISLQLLKKVKEDGEVPHMFVVNRMVRSIKLKNVKKELATARVLNLLGMASKERKRA
jgi:MFS family permease